MAKFSKKMVYIRPLSVLFFILLGIDIYAEFLQNYIIVYITKPLLMPCLLAIFSLNCDDHHILERTTMNVALISSFLGDILLLQPRGDRFLAGLVSFLVAHLSYITMFIAQIRESIDHSNQRLTLSTMLFKSIPFVVFITVIYSVFYPALTDPGNDHESLLVPVFLYTLIIVAMAYISFLRDTKVTGFRRVFIGALLFVLSDTCLAVNKFVAPIPMPALFVMVTYGLGQYLIMMGILKSIEKETKHF